MYKVQGTMYIVQDVMCRLQMPIKNFTSVETTCSHIMYHVVRLCTIPAQRAFLAARNNKGQR